MVHPTHVLRPGGSPKHRALAYRSHRPCCPTPSAPFGCPTRRSQIAIEPAAPPDVSLPAIAARPLVKTASGLVQFRVQSETAVRVWFQQLFALGPTLERGELSFRPLRKRTACHDAAPLKPCMSAIERAGELAYSALNHVDVGPCLDADP